MSLHHKLNTIAFDPGNEPEEDLVTKSYTICDAAVMNAEIPSGFDAVRLSIDGRVKADLKWTQARERAALYVSQGLKIFWEIDLGLFKELSFPLNNQTQYLSLCLSLEHFCNTLWKEFAKDSIGVVLYRGSGDFTHDFQWDDEQLVSFRDWLRDVFGNVCLMNACLGTFFDQYASAAPDLLSKNPLGKRLVSLFCRNVCSDYLDLLAGQFPNTLTSFALLDMTEVADSLLSALLVDKDRYERIHLGIKGNFSLRGDLGWEGAPSHLGVLLQELPQRDSAEAPRVGVYVPAFANSHPQGWKEVEKAMDYARQSEASFRFISESHLMAEWDGLDAIIIGSENITPSIKRQLQGFKAAGGELVYVDNNLKDVSNG